MAHENGCASVLRCLKDASREPPRKSANACKSMLVHQPSSQGQHGPLAKASQHNPIGRDSTGLSLFDHIMHGCHRLQQTLMLFSRSHRRPLDVKPTPQLGAPHVGHRLRGGLGDRQFNPRCGRTQAITDRTSKNIWAHAEAMECQHKASCFVVRIHRLCRSFLSR